MKNRCQSSTSKDWANYGGRGITVCERWQKFENFLEDMGGKPGEGWSIERENVNGNYEPGNCKWAQRTEQQNNRRNTKLITWNGVTQSEAQWANQYGITRGSLHYRLSIGETMPYALRPSRNVK
jgi:hypothetical protein